MHPIACPPAAGSNTEFLSFELGGLDYGIEACKVKQLRSLGSLERFAADGAIVKGVALSRGVIMPLVDMRLAFAGARPAGPGQTDVIVLQLSSCVMGMVVDRVGGVVRIGSDQISALPYTQVDADYLIGLGVTDGRSVVLVDIDRLMSIQKETPAQAVA